jgi:hypothetical protein
LGIAGVALAVFAPLNSNEECVGTASGGSACTTSSSSLWQDERAAAVALVVVVPAVSLLVTASALADAQRNSRSRVALFASTFVLAATAVLLIASVGIFVAPAMLAALVASLGTLLRMLRRSE